jgi:Skp family chaperone for outer membrane proteins
MMMMETHFVPLSDYDKHVHMYKTDFSQLKNEVHMLEKNDFASLKADNERLTQDVEKLKEKMREELNKLQAGVRLDLSLEKGRVRDEAQQHDLKIREVDNRIKTEVLMIKSSMYSLKWDIIKYIIGAFISAGALLITYIRLMVNKT